MKDTELSKLLEIPISTLSEWKKNEHKRKILYELIKNMDKEELEERVKAIKLLKGIK